MRALRACSVGTWLTLLALGLTACGQAFNLDEMARVRAASQLATRSAWEPPIVLEDFDTTGHQYVHEGPVSHPFFEALEFTPVKPAGSGTTVLEILGANRPKPRKGFLVTSDVEYDGAFIREVGEKEQLAQHVKVGFKWAVNGAATQDPSLFAQVVFVFESKRLGRKGLGYVWSNRHCPGTVLAGQLGNGEYAVPLRLIVLSQGVGLGQPCSDAALSKMALAPVERDFVADVRWAFNESTPLGELALVPLGDSAGCVSDKALPPRQFVQDAQGRNLPNTDLMGIAQVAFGAELARGICAHAIVDDVVVQKAWPR
jgi:hypothetical protein